MVRKGYIISTRTSAQGNTQFVMGFPTPEGQARSNILYVGLFHGVVPVDSGMQLEADWQERANEDREGNNGVIFRPIYATSVPVVTAAPRRFTPAPSVEAIEAAEAAATPAPAAPVTA